MYNLNLTGILGNNEVTLTDMLDARENRIVMQQQILSDFNMTLISFTLNISGSHKTFPLAEKAFIEGKNLIINHLERHHINIAYSKGNSNKTGYEVFFAVDCNPYTIKKLMVNIENSCLLGRIFDIDVLKPNGEKISRQDINSKNRTCLLCGDFAHLCSRSKKHPIEELISKTVEIMADYFNQKFANYCASYACRALIYEVTITPKPGLVDRNNNGAHEDMDIYTFIDSSAVLTSYFRDFVLSGIEFYKDEPQQLFNRIRYLGMIAEESMFKATCDVNTHKGLIFSLGIICTALGYLHANNKHINTENILELSKYMTVDLLNDFKDINKENAKTYGEKLYANYGIKGIRGEASNGFISVKNYGLPVLSDLINKGFSLNDAGVLTLLNLIANVKDTNIISRSNIETAENIQLKIKKLIQDYKIENIPMDLIYKMDEEFIEMNISPGGCADLLAITFMLYFIENYNL